jgi:succinoglycan biosynthesis protein ExoM
MTKGPRHISVCICTFKRPQFLRHLLEELGRQDTGDQFTFSIVVADNDHLRSAEPVVSDFAATSPVPVRYCVEPRQNIARTRNKAIENATGDYIVFIDDDEFPTKRWLLTLLEACHTFDADGVLGPVKPHYDEGTPEWFIKGKFYDRETYPTGLVIDWRKGRTGNVLLKRGVFSGEVEPFRPEFRSGEDQDFFYRMIERGHRFVWCNEAVAYEFVPQLRWKRTYLLRRALLRGAMGTQNTAFGSRDIVKSIIAVPVYLVMLPVAAMVSHYRFMKLLVSLCDHLGKLLALAGINPIKEPYVTE